MLRVIKRKVLLADDFAAIGGDKLTHPLFMT